LVRYPVTGPGLADGRGQLRWIQTGSPFPTCLPTAHTAFTLPLLPDITPLQRVLLPAVPLLVSYARLTFQISRIPVWLRTSYPVPQFSSQRHAAMLNLRVAATLAPPPAQPRRLGACVVVSYRRGSPPLLRAAGARAGGRAAPLQHSYACCRLAVQRRREGYYRSSAMGMEQTPYT